MKKDFETKNFEIRGIPKNAPEGIKKQIMRANAQVRKYKEMGINNYEDVAKARADGRLPTRPKGTKFKASGGRVTMRSGGLAKRGKGCEIE